MAYLLLYINRFERRVLGINLAFSWSTGRIETNIHNPHYYEWLRRTGGEVPRNPRDVQCGRELRHSLAREIQRKIAIVGGGTHHVEFFFTAIRSVIHLQNVQMTPYANVDPVLNHQALRIKFMRNQISEADFKMVIQRNNKKNEKRREMRDILLMFITTFTDTIYRLYAYIDSRYDDNFEHLKHDVNTDFDNFVTEINALFSYANECIEIICDSFDSVVLELGIISGHNYDTLRRKV